MDSMWGQRWSFTPHALHIIAVCTMCVTVVSGLAIYNSHILEFQFPMVLYKKLLGKQVALDDLAELQPDIHRSDSTGSAEAGLYICC